MTTTTKTKKQKNNVTPIGKRVPKEFRVKLTEQQLMDRGKRAAQMGMELKAMEEAFKAEEDAWKARKATYKSDKKNLEESRRKIDEEVDTKSAAVQEEVTLVLNHENNQAEYWYEDKENGWMIIDTRPLEDGEMQAALFQDQADSMPDSGQTVEE